jgi:hypothetical protein
MPTCVPNLTLSQATKKLNGDDDDDENYYCTSKTIRVTSLSLALDRYMCPFLS